MCCRCVCVCAANKILFFFVPSMKSYTRSQIFVFFFIFMFFLAFCWSSVWAGHTCRLSVQWASGGLFFFFARVAPQAGRGKRARGRDVIPRMGSKKGMPAPRRLVVPRWSVRGRQDARTERISFVSFFFRSPSRQEKDKERKKEASVGDAIARCRARSAVPATMGVDGRTRGNRRHPRRRHVAGVGDGGDDGRGQSRAGRVSTVCRSHIDADQPFSVGHCCRVCSMRTGDAIARHSARRPNSWHRARGDGGGLTWPCPTVPIAKSKGGMRDMMRSLLYTIPFCRPSHDEGGRRGQKEERNGDHKGKKSKKKKKEITVRQSQRRPRRDGESGRRRRAAPVRRPQRVGP